MLAALALVAALAASPDPSAGGRTCYNLGQGGETHYYPTNDHTILVSAGIHAYRITTTPSPALADPTSVVQVRGSGIVCSPLELQLFLTGPSVGRTGLIVQSITPMSRAEAEDLRRGQPKISQFRNGQ